MANNYFNFKQFTILQDKTSMKVCTDSCILGAWASLKVKEGNTDINRSLDIGCGTGLLSLMLAQHIAGDIDGLEINVDAAQQAAENAMRSCWSPRINIIHTSLQNFDTKKKYDLIISNPPFFENDLHSGDKNKNSSKHDLTLTLEELIYSIRRLLSPGGHVFILIPYNRTDYFTNTCKEAGLFIREKLFVRQSILHSPFRSILWLSNEEYGPELISELTIHDDKRNYTSEFIQLLKPYYLNL